MMILVKEGLLGQRKLWKFIEMPSSGFPKLNDWEKRNELTEPGAQTSLGWGHSVVS